MPRLTFTVEVELSKVTGVFVAKDAMADELVSAIEGADPGTIDVDGSEYQVDSWSVSVE